jgi:hypothetical protein
MAILDLEILGLVSETGQHNNDNILISQDLLIQFEWYF